MFKNDSWFQGILTGLGLVAITAAIFYVAINMVDIPFIAPKEKLYILAIVPNILFMRWLYKTKSFTKTGHGILVVTGMAVIGFLFWLKFGL